MDTSLFEKYTKAITRKKAATTEVIQYIHEKTGVLLSEKEVHISKTKVILHTTAMKKSVLHINHIEKVLEEKGMSLG